jgi:hypothetical protein
MHKPYAKPYNLYPDLGYWFLLFIALVLAGFYISYFSVAFTIKESVIHIHFGVMALWVGMLITQPFLIKFKKLAWHRLLGKVSYVLVPLALGTSFLMVRYGYHTYTDRLALETVEGSARYSAAEVLHLAARNNALPFIYLFWMGLFYSLAIFHRKRSAAHARYMLATALTVLGPTVDRIFFIALDIAVFPFGIPVEVFAFVVIDMLLGYLLLKDYQQKRNPTTLLLCLSLYVGSQLLFFVVREAAWWQSFTAFAM